MAAWLLVVAAPPSIETVPVGAVPSDAGMSMTLQIDLGVATRRRRQVVGHHGDAAGGRHRLLGRRVVDKCLGGALDERGAALDGLVRSPAELEGFGACERRTLYRPSHRRWARSLTGSDSSLLADAHLGSGVAVTDGPRGADQVPPAVRWKNSTNGCCLPVAAPRCHDRSCRRRRHGRRWSS